MTDLLDRIPKDFTPGPWKWEGNSGSPLQSEAEGLSYINRSIIEVCAGTVYSEYSSDAAYVDVAEPNAVLIALAPELAAALRDARARVDIRALDALATQLETDATTFHGGLSLVAMRSVADIIRQAIGAPISWPTREAGVAFADSYYPGTPTMRLAFNHGVKWAVENYTQDTPR